MAQLLVWLRNHNGRQCEEQDRLGEYLVWIMLRCNLTLSLPANLLVAELPAQICFTPLTRKQNSLETKQFFMCEGRDFLKVAQTPSNAYSRNYMVKLLQIMLCFAYTMFLIWAWLDMGADMLTVTTRWWIHPKRTIRILRNCCFWISNHTITQLVQTVLVKYFKSCIPQ